MQTLFSIILPLLAIRVFLNPVPSLYLSSPNPAPLTATAQYSYLNHIPAFSRRLHSPFIITIPSTRRQLSSKYCFHSSSFWRCRNQSRSKLPFPSSPTQVLERNIHSLLT